MSEAGDNARYRAMGFSELIDECKEKDRQIALWRETSEQTIKELAKKHGEQLVLKDQEIAALRSCKEIAEPPRCIALEMEIAALKVEIERLSKIIRAPGEY